jgi:hypothetical protein
VLQNWRARTLCQALVWVGGSEILTRFADQAVKQHFLIKKAAVKAMCLYRAQGLASRVYPTRLALGHEFQSRVSHDLVFVGESGDVFLAEQHGISL